MIQRPARGAAGCPAACDALGLTGGVGMNCSALNL